VEQSCFDLWSHRIVTFRTGTRLLTIDDSPTYLEYLNGQLGPNEGYQIEKLPAAGRMGLKRILNGGFDCVSGRPGDAGPRWH